MGPVVHIHFGPGKLGLGLLVWSGLLARYEVHVVAQPGSPVTESTTLEIVVCAEDATDQEPLSLPVASACQAHAVADLGTPVRSAIERAEHVLVTTAVTTAGIAAITPMLIALAEARPRRRGATTTFIAGENDPGDSYADLVSKLGARGVDCRRTMVNRICFEPYELRRPGARVVRADCLAEWLIEGQPDTPALAALAGLAHVRFVEDVEPYEVRKRWLVNGGHLALAIMARLHNYERLDIESSEPGRSEWLRRLQAVLIRGLQRHHPQLEDNVAYGLAHVNAWIRHDDPTARILRRLTRSDIGPFLTDLDRKLGQGLVSSRIARDERWSVVQELLAALHTVLCNPQQYEDLASVTQHPECLDAARDESCIEHYQVLLVGLVGPDVAQQRAAELAKVFADHRDALGVG